jgi:Ca2+-binding EF-hand superfamily protein
MRKLVLGLSATALMASVAFAAEPTADTTRLAAADSAVFNKLDADADGRISAIEASNDSKIAAGFTQADADKDGYLSKAEFANLAKMKSSMDHNSTTPRADSSNESSRSEDSSTASPQR